MKKKCTLAEYTSVTQEGLHAACLGNARFCQ